MASVTVSGLEPRRMLQLLMEGWEEQGFLHGPAFVKNQGDKVSSGRYEAIILGSLLDHQEWEREQQDKVEKLFDGVDIKEVYRISWSFKQGAITRAQEAGVRQPEVEFMGQWRTVEQAAGRKPGWPVGESTIRSLSKCRTPGCASPRPFKPRYRKTSQDGYSGFKLEGWTWRRPGMYGRVERGSKLLDQARLL
jgi:hypothetical protein